MSDTPAWKVAGAVGFYMAVALVMVMVNKSVLSHSDLPMTFLFLQLSVSVVLLHIWSLLSGSPSRTLYLPPTPDPSQPAPSPLSRFTFHAPAWSSRTLLALAPLCTINIVGLIFNLLCLRLVDASFFQVARGLTLPLTVLLQASMDARPPTKYTVLSCLIVSYGFAHTLIVRMEAPPFGMVLGLLSAAMIAVHAVLIRSALRQVEGRTLDLAYWQNTVGAIALLPGVWYELPRLGEADMSSFLTGSAVTGVTGFLICVAGLLSIKVTSPVTHMFSSAVRSVLQTALGVYFFDDILNTPRLVSIALILAGSTLYTYAKAYLDIPAPVVEEEKDKEKV